MNIYKYRTNGVCSSQINIKINKNIIEDIEVIGGCMGNALGIRALCIGQNIDDVILKLKGIKCGRRETSCPDQIAMALLEYKKR